MRSFNTFGVEAKSRYYFSFSALEEIQNFVKLQPFPNTPLLILGGGSNILFTRDFEGLVIHPLIKGIKILSETEKFSIVEAAAGEVWDDFVKYCVGNNLYGVENLSLIPGSAGASPIQNIGAYGAEVSEVIEAVKGIDLETGEVMTFLGSECRFGYRNSLFKQELKNKFLVTSVVFKLMKNSELKLDYGNLREEVMSLGDFSLKNVRQAIINIRTSKLPDPAITGNAGSFFKNPVVPVSLFEKIKKQYLDVPSYPVSDKETKIPAGWLIEKCGWKGRTIGNAGVHDKQALIIVNKGNATGREIFKLSETIIKSVFSSFGITLEREVNII